MPSTRRPAIPYPIARAAKVVASAPAKPEKLEIAHWLLTTFMMTGARYTAAKVQAEWKSPSAVDPSPHHTAAIRLSPFAAEAIAQPTACGYCVVRLPEIEKKPNRFSEYMMGSCLPPSLSPVFE